MAAAPLAKLLATIVQSWRSPALVKAAWTVIVAGLGIMVPGVRDLALLVAIAAINWALERLKRPPLPPDTSAPWWAGLILVGLGLFFLNLHSRKDVEITGIVDEHGRVAIKGRIRCSDRAEAERLLQSMGDAIKELTGEDLPE